MSTNASPAPQPSPALPKGVEARSIDHVSDAERHGTVWPLTAVWVAGNANVGTLAVGAVGIAAGAGLFWTLVAIVLGCAFGTIFAALHSTQGPHLGLPQLIQSRPQFGYLGAIIVFVLALITYVGFNVFVNILGGESLQVTAHVPAKLSFVIVSVVAALIALVGYDWIHRVSRWLTVCFTLVFVVLSVVALTHGGVSVHEFAPGHFHATAFLLQFGAAAGYQINWAIYVSDYTRYLPAKVSGRQMFACTYLGMTVSAAWLGGLGAVLATSFPALDSVGSAHAAGDLLFGGFGAIVVLVSLAGLITVAAMNTYGAALTLISMLDCFFTLSFTRALRAVSIGVVTVVALVLSMIASSNFLTAFAGFLTVLLYLFAPWTAINLTDYFLIRRGRYSITEMFNRDGIYGRWNTRGLVAYAIGFIGELPFANTTWFQGPISKAMGGADVAPFVGLALGFALYWFFYRHHNQESELRRAVTTDVTRAPVPGAAA